MIIPQFCYGKICSCKDSLKWHNSWWYIVQILILQWDPVWEFNKIVTFLVAQFVLKKMHYDSTLLDVVGMEYESEGEDKQAPKSAVR